MKTASHASYDRDFANRHWRVLLRVNEVFSYFRTSFLGKASPVHFFWGSFDLAVTRFSGAARAADDQQQSVIAAPHRA